MQGTHDWGLAHQILAHEPKPFHMAPVVVLATKNQWKYIRDVARNVCRGVYKTHWIYIRPNDLPTKRSMDFVGILSVQFRPSFSSLNMMHEVLASVK